MRHATHNLGTVDFPVSCSKQTQTEFTYGVALLHHMTYPQAREAFQRAAMIDSRCAMAYWGEAMTLFQPLWPTRPGPAALQQGWDAGQKAKSLQPPTQREQLFIAAAEAFFRDPTSKDYWLRIRRWEAAMEELYNFPTILKRRYSTHWRTSLRRRQTRSPEQMPIVLPRFCFAFTKRIQIIRARCIISFMPTMFLDASASC